MPNAGAWLRLVVAILATWRVTHLLAREDGPWRILVRLRAALGTGMLGELMDCFYCLSLWVAMAFVSVVTLEWRFVVPVWLALSGAACLLERTERAPSPPVLIQPIDDTTGGSDDGMLWTGTERAPERERTASDHRTGNGSADGPAGA